MQVNVLNNDKKMIEIEMVDCDSAIPRMLVEELNKDKGVEFAAFKKDHPILGWPKIVLKTKKDDPLDMIVEKLEGIKKEFTDFHKQFKDAVR